MDLLWMRTVHTVCVCVCMCAYVHTRTCTRARAYTAHSVCVCVSCSVVSDSLRLQAPLSMGFSREEYWSELPFPPAGDLPNPRTGPTSLMSPSLAGGFFIAALPQKPCTVENVTSILRPNKAY